MGSTTTALQKALGWWCRRRPERTKRKSSTFERGGGELFLGIFLTEREYQIGTTANTTNVVREPPRELRPERIPRRRVGKLENVPEVCGAGGRRDAERTRARNGRRNDLESEGKRGKSRGRSESDGGEDDGRGGEENTTTTTKDVTLRKDAYERERRKTRASTGTRANRHKRRRLFKTQT